MSSEMNLAFPCWAPPEFPDPAGKPTRTPAFWFWGLVLQQAAFTDIALFWGWRDRDGEIVWKAGSFEPTSRLADEPEISRVDDAQVERMGCISDAELLMEKRPMPELTGEVHFTRCLSIALQASQEEYPGDLVDFAERNR